jgi:hypothetical protein
MGLCIALVKFCLQGTGNVAGSDASVKYTLVHIILDYNRFAKSIK